MEKINSLHLGYGNDAKETTLQTALLYKDHPKTCKAKKYPTTPSKEDLISGYKLRKNHVENSQVVPFCTALHIDFLQCSR